MTKMLGTKKPEGLYRLSEGDIKNIERLMKELEKQKPKKEAKKTGPKNEVQPESPIITPNSDSWLIENDEYKIKLSKSLISPETQEHQINNYLANTSSFKLANYQEIFLIGKILLDNNPTQKDEILSFLRNSFQKYWIQTASGVLYKPKAGDLIIHDKGMPSEYSFEADFVGPDRIMEKADETISAKLTGLDNLDEINKVSSFLADRDKTYLFRLNSKPEKNDYMIAGFYAGSGRASLDCSGDPQYSGSGLGVNVEKKFYRK